jgi:hypothetical protein
MALGLTQPLNRNENHGYLLSGQMQLVHRADNLAIFICQVPRNSGATSSWNPKGLTRTVVGLLLLAHVRLNTSTMTDHYIFTVFIQILFASKQTGLKVNILVHF